MVKVRTYDAYFGLEMAEESTYGTDPGSGYLRVPFRSEDFHFEDDVFPDSEEFAALGALLSIEKGRRIVRGTLTVEPAYDTQWFWMLFGHCFSYEDYDADNDVLDVGTGVAGLDVHGFTRGMVVPDGLTFRAWKSGPDDTGYVDTIVGCLVTGWTWDQPEGDRATLSIDFIGKDITSALASAEGTLTSLEASPKKVKAIDFDGTARTGGYAIIKSGATLTDLNVTGFNISVNNSVEAGSGFLTSLLTLAKPGIVGNRSVELSITGLVEQDIYAANKPWYEFKNQTASQFVLIYESGDIAAATTPYAIRFDIPKIEWTDVRYGATAAGEIPLTATARGMWENVENLTSSLDDFDGGGTGPAIPGQKSCDLRVLMQCASADAAGTPPAFTGLAASPT